MIITDDELNDDLFKQASQLQHDGCLPQAITLYEKIINQNPYHVRALHHLGLVYAQLGDMPNVIHYVMQALNLTPNDPGLHNNLGNAYKNSHQLDLAIYHYQKAIELAPNYAQAYNNLAGIYAMQGLYKQSLAHYRLAIHAQPDFSVAHFNLGLLLMTNNQLTAAAVQFNNVLALNPEHIDAKFYLGVLNLEANRLDQAEKFFQDILLHNNEHVQTLTNLGVIALKRQDGQLAINYFSKALALDNTHVEARNNLAATFMHYDRFENALMHYDVLLQQDSNNLEYLYNSGVAQMALGHLNEAIGYFERLIVQKADHFAALNNLAAIYIRMENRQKAYELLKRALKTNPNDKVSQHMLYALSNSTKQADTCPDYAKNLFNNYALYYDQHVQKYLHYSLPNHIVFLLSELGLERVEHILDLGCGTGLIGQVLSDISQKLDGVDIADKMLEQARVKGIYTHLINDEALRFLKTTSNRYDLIVAADVLPYFGELEELFKWVKNCLTPGGYFIFTTEISNTLPWQLQITARFAHHPDYLQQLAKHYDLQKCYDKKVVARHQDNQELLVSLMALQHIKKECLT